MSVTFDPADVDRGLLDRLNSINNTLTTQWNRLQNIRNTVDDTGAQADRARNRVRDAENLIDRARQELDKAKDAVSKVVSEVAVVRETDESWLTELMLMWMLMSCAGHQTSRRDRRAQQHDAAGRGGSQTGRQVRLCSLVFVVLTPEVSLFLSLNTIFHHCSPQAQDGRRSDREDRQRRQRHVDQSVQPAAEDSGWREQDEPGDRRAQQEVRHRSDTVQTLGCSLACSGF